MADYTVERMRTVFDTNVLASFLRAREAVRRMSTRSGGGGGAIDSMTIGLPKEVATEGVRVNAVRPGLILTELHAAVLWLISDEASYVTGALLDVGGGR